MIFEEPAKIQKIIPKNLIDIEQKMKDDLEVYDCTSEGDMQFLMN
jgi:hypothetical protein